MAAFRLGARHAPSASQNRRGLRLLPRPNPLGTACQTTRSSHRRTGWTGKPSRPVPREAARKRTCHGRHLAARPTHLRGSCTPAATYATTTRLIQHAESLPTWAAISLMTRRLTRRTRGHPLGCPRRCPRASRPAIHIHVHAVRSAQLAGPARGSPRARSARPTSDTRCTHCGGTRPITARRVVELGWRAHSVAARTMRVRQPSPRRPGVGVHPDHPRSRPHIPRPQTSWSSGRKLEPPHLWSVAARRRASARSAQQARVAGWTPWSGQAPQGITDERDAFADLGGRASGVAEDQARSGRALAVPGQRLHLHSARE